MSDHVPCLKEIRQGLCDRPDHLADAIQHRLDQMPKAVSFILLPRDWCEVMVRHLRQIGSGTVIGSEASGLVGQERVAQESSSQNSPVSSPAEGDRIYEGITLQVANMLPFTKQRVIESVHYVVYGTFLDASLSSLTPVNDEKFAFDNGSGMTEVMTTTEMIAEIQRLGKRCEELIRATPTRAESAIETHAATTETDPRQET